MDQQFHDEMESLQFQGYKVKWYIHRKGHFGKGRGYHSRSIAYQVAAQHSMTVTPDFED